MSRFALLSFLFVFCLFVVRSGAEVGTLLFADDFSVHEPDGRPSLINWGSPTNQHDPQRLIRVVSDGVAERFGVPGQKAFRLYKNETSIATETTAITSTSFSRGAQVVTVVFDFWQNPHPAGPVAFRVGTGGVTNINRVHEVQFHNGALSGAPGIYTPGQSYRMEVVMNNSAGPVTYDGGQATVASDRFDVWIDGVRVLSDHTWGRGSLAVGSNLTSLQFACFLTNRSELMVRNLRVYEGAVVGQQEPPEEPAAFELFLAPDGLDSNDGRSLSTPILTLARAQQILAATSPAADVRIRVLPGRYHAQRVSWTYTRPGRRIIFEAFDPLLPRPVFDGCEADGSCPGGTWLRLPFSGGRQTNLEFRHLRFENYQTAISFDGNRNSETGFNGGNVISGCYFYRIGNVFNPSLAPSTAAVRLVNSKDNIIENNDFVDVINTTSGGLIHAIYVAHLSDRNFIVQNRFINHSGDSVRVRDYSNDNLIFDNVFIRAGADGYSEWYCDQDVRDDCTKPSPECPSWHNEFRYNLLVSSWSGGALGTFRFHQGDSTTGCSKPTEASVRLRTSDNTRGELPAPVELWRHREFNRTDRANPEVAGDAAAPAGDGIPNLLKYFLGLPAAQPTPLAGLPRPQWVDGRLGLRFWQDPAAAGLTVGLEASPNLTDWQIVPAERVEGPVVDGRLEVLLREAAGGMEEGGFLRLRVRRADR
jgi:hypothetical protein